MSAPFTPAEIAKEADMFGEDLDADRELRLECLRLAVAFQHPHHDPMTVAETFFRYVRMGRRRPNQTGPETADHSGPAAEQEADA